MASTIARDRKSTRLNSSHTVISYAVFCLKKKTAATLCAVPDRRDQTLAEKLDALFRAHGDASLVVLGGAVGTPCGAPGRCLSFFFSDPAATQIYTLSLHDALPI